MFWKEKLHNLAWLPKKNCNYLRSRKRQSGATLIELMISVFVFAIGVLGYSALQTRSIQATFDNAQRDDVVWISDALVGRIRVNTNARATYALELTDLNECPAQPDAVCSQQQGQAQGAVNQCTATQLATFDVWDELCNNPAGGLQAVKGLTIDLNDDGTDMTLTSTWCSRSVEGEEDVDGGDGGECTHALAQQSYQLVFRP